MKLYPRIRKTIKWGGAAVTVLLMVVWIGSGWCRAMWASPHDFQASLWGGRLEMSIGRMSQFPISQHFFKFEVEPSTLQWVPHWVKWPTWRLVIVPLWIFPSVTLLVTAAAWRLDIRAHRRAKLNLCAKCGYDRTGIARDAKCPECGRYR